MPFLVDSADGKFPTRQLLGSPALGLEKVVQRCSVQECFDLGTTSAIWQVTVMFPKLLTVDSETQFTGNPHFIERIPHDLQ